MSNRSRYVRWSWLAASFVVAAGGGRARAEARDTLADTWEATDGLGRELPTSEQSGAPNQRRVLMFYYVWHQRHEGGGPYDISKIIAGKTQPFADAAFGPSPAFHHWGEPALGYYDINDEFVLRRHAQLLADAQVDAVVLDVTNAATYDATWKKLCAIYADLRASGNRTPAISFVANSSSDATVQHLYDVLYSKNECAGLLYELQGKPLMMAARGEGLSAEARELFTFRQSWAWSDPNGWFGDGRDKWPWLDNHPQQWGWHEDAETPEEMPVGVAQHPTSNYGRSYHAGKQPPLDAAYNTADTARGLGFQEQWDRVLQVKPAFAFVTQWNEWLAQRFVKCGTYTTGATHFLGAPLACEDTHFIDDFNQEFSRDVEPMKGGHEDAYYYQLVANVRRFKGARAVAEATPARAITDLTLASFEGVGPEYLDDVGDVTHRSAPGYAGPQVYENASGRNDLTRAVVARDETTLYFHAQTSAALSPRTDARWMVLWLDTDQDASTGCFGFDYAINRSREGAEASVERCSAAEWLPAGKARLLVGERELVLAVPREAVSLPASTSALSFRFKWTDNVPEPLQGLTLLDQGDSAPNGRFTYRYVAPQDLANEPPNGAGGSAGAGGPGPSGAGGVPSAGAHPGGGPVSGAATAGVNAAATPTNSGCNCRAVRDATGSWPWALLLALVGWCARRRQLKI